MRWPTQGGGRRSRLPARALRPQPCPPPHPSWGRAASSHPRAGRRRPRASDASQKLPLPEPDADRVVGLGSARASPGSAVAEGPIAPPGARRDRRLLGGRVWSAVHAGRGRSTRKEDASIEWQSYQKSPKGNFAQKQKANKSLAKGPTPHTSADPPPPPAVSSRDGEPPLQAATSGRGGAEPFRPPAGRLEKAAADADRTEARKGKKSFIFFVIKLWERIVYGGKGKGKRSGEFLGSSSLLCATERRVLLRPPSAPANTAQSGSPPPRSSIREVPLAGAWG